MTIIKKIILICISFLTLFSASFAISSDSSLLAEFPFDSDTLDKIGSSDAAGHALVFDDFQDGTSANPVYSAGYWSFDPAFSSVEVKDSSFLGKKILSLKGTTTNSWIDFDFGGTRDFHLRIPFLLFTNPIDLKSLFTCIIVLRENGSLIICILEVLIPLSQCVRLHPNGI